MYICMLRLSEGGRERQDHELDLDPQDLEKRTGPLLLSSRLGIPRGGGGGGGGGGGPIPVLQLGFVSLECRRLKGVEYEPRMTMK
jgi:hypothetical protein